MTLKAIERFVPLTLRMGFLESDFERTSDAYLRWQTELAAQRMSTIHSRHIREGLNGLLSLQPLTTPICRTFLLETRSRWTAFVDNGLRVSDPGSPVGHLSSIIPCRSVVETCVPDRSTVRKRGALRTYGAVIFTIYGPNGKDRMNRERSIGVMNDGSRWKFWAEGNTQPFEEVGQYRARKVRERFTCDMLERYCAALGIYPFSEAFFGSRGLVVSIPDQWSPLDPSMSLDDARRLTLLT